MLNILPAIFISVLGLSQARVFADEVDLSSKVTVYLSSGPDSGGNLFSGLADSSKRAEGKELICRSFSAVSLPEESIPGRETIIKWTGLSEWMDKGAEGPVKTSVSGIYIHFGLVIINGNSEETLVIDTVSINGRGAYNGQTFNYSKSLNAGYCGLPFFYVVAPGEDLSYHPLSENFLENLTLYMDGFPVVDSTREEEPQIVIPEYDIELTLMGWFVSEEREDQSKPFFKRLGFKTKAGRFVKTSKANDGESVWSHTALD